MVLRSQNELFSLKLDSGNDKCEQDWDHVWKHLGAQADRKANDNSPINQRFRKLCCKFRYTRAQNSEHRSQTAVTIFSWMLDLHLNDPGLQPKQIE